MRRPLLVKVCGMRELENVRAVSRCAPDYLGFIFVPESPRYVDVPARAALLHSVPVTIRTVAVFRDAEISEVEDAVRRYRCTAVQLHGNEDTAYVAECKQRFASCQVFKAIGLGESGDVLTRLPRGPDLYIFDSAQPGSGEEFDWRMLDDYRSDVPFFLAGGLGAHNIERVVQCARRYTMCFGIDINSKVECRAGVKDEAAVKAVIEGVRV